MIKEVNRGQNKILLYLAIASLIVFSAIVITGTVKGRYSFILKRKSGSIVLGIADKLPLKDANQEAIEKMLEGVATSARSELSKKAVEAEVILKDTVAREVRDLSRTQIKAIQTNICREWGVVDLQIKPTGPEKQ